MHSDWALIEILPAKTKFLPAETGLLPAKTGLLPAKTALLPAKTVLLPAKTGLLPAKTVLLPAKTGLLPAKTVLLPAKTVLLPAKTALLPAKTALLPAKTVLLPAETGLMPAETEFLPAKNKNLPAENENLPAKAENLRKKSGFFRKKTRFFAKKPDKFTYFCEFNLKNREKMGKTKNIALITLFAVLCSACGSTKTIRNRMKNIKVDLDYELTSPVYEGNPDKTVRLNSIADKSGMGYFTAVKGGKTLFLPFILFYYWRTKYRVVLGESTLTQLYREFLTDALLAECNRSARFNLETGGDRPVEDTYSLDVSIIHNETRSGIQETGTLFVIPVDPEIIDLQHTAYRQLAVTSDLKIAVSLTKDGQVLWKKDYAAHEKLGKKSFGSDFHIACEASARSMSECLSFATRQVVTEICRDLNLILSIR
ncbi:MAG: hypothetical protein LBB73_09460 [Dysgonamonadaceae bacterium]|nr:hypothetical protein [Dysgonamonadaceae bacterium]